MLHTPRDERDVYLVFGRVVPYKRVDWRSRRASGLAGACSSPARAATWSGCGRSPAPHTEFLGQVPDADVPRLFAQASALLFPGLEDFGIVPVEAQAAGLPVIAYDAGGVSDSVIDGTTGVLYRPGSVEGLIEGIVRFESHSFDHDAIRENARRFTPERFASAFSKPVDGAPGTQLLGGASDRNRHRYAGPRRTGAGGCPIRTGTWARGEPPKMTSSTMGWPASNLRHSRARYGWRRGR